MSHHLSLVDWRTRVADLYASVRTAPTPADGHRSWVHGRTELFGSHPQSPTTRTSATVRYAPYDPRMRFHLPLLPAEPETRGVPAGDDGTVQMQRVGRVQLPEPVAGSLDVWWLDQYGGGLFVPLRDGTSGTTSYGGGRYLIDTTKGAWLGGTDGTLVIDLNFAYHPSCRYDDRWQCPLAPPGNTIAAPVEVGEQL